MNVRIRRLEADWNAIQTALRDHPKIQVVGTAGNPPQRYHLRYCIGGLEQKPDGMIVQKNEHLVEITLLRRYPRQAPVCRMLDPVFHPNIAPHVICIGDHWAAGESLVQIVFQIGQMIAFQSYNVKSPLNGEAAKWTEENLDKLPVDDSPLIPPLGTLSNERARKEMNEGGNLTCSACGQSYTPAKIWRCSQGHIVCPNCSAVCLGCGGPLCPICEATNCGICFQRFCAKCLTSCHICGRRVCLGHAAACKSCGKTACHQCLAMCEFCGQLVCQQHLTQCPSCGHLLCSTHLVRSTGRCPKCAGELKAPSMVRPSNQPNQSVVFTCPSCGVKLVGAVEHVGLRVNCPRCGSRDITIPSINT